jgi:phosphoribosylamine--glycine ligase
MKEALDAIKSIMSDKIFGESGNKIVIEEFLKGPEVTVLSFTDGKTLIPMISSMDHKRAFDNNQGPNTGGMGVIAPNPHYCAQTAAICEKTIFLPTIRAMEMESCPFKGCLYFGLILTEQGPRVIEYNCRFGDPEAQVILPLLETDLFDIMQAVSNGSLEKTDIRFSAAHAACVVLASGGYPGAYKTGFPVSGLDDAEKDGAVVYHAGTTYKDGSFYTAGGRVFGVTAVADGLDLALQKAYKAAGLIDFEGMFYRKDIGNY